MTFRKKETTEETKHFPQDYTTEELREIRSDFEQEYNDAIEKNPESVKIQGRTYIHGILKLMNQYRAITMYNKQLFICDPGIEIWNRRYGAMQELQNRKNYAEKKELESLEKMKDNLIEEKSMPYSEEEIDPALIPF